MAGEAPASGFLQRNATAFAVALNLVVTFGTVIWFAASAAGDQRAAETRLTRVEAQAAQAVQQATPIAVLDAKLAAFDRRLDSIEGLLRDLARQRFGGAPP